MMGAEVSIDSEAKVCSPDVTNREMEKYWAVNGVSLDADNLAYPCGLLSKYYPLDTFEFTDPSRGEFWQVPISSTDISWAGLKGSKFKSIDKNREWVNLESETFINWMRPNTWFNVYKAWGRLDADMQPANYTVKIFNGNFCSIDLNPEIFAGQKLFGIAVLSPLGGRNPYVPGTLLVLAVCSWLLTALFLYLSREEEELYSKHKQNESNTDLDELILAEEDAKD